VDIVPQAIDDANANARRNGIENAKFFAGTSKRSPAFTGIFYFAIFCPYHPFIVADRRGSGL